MKGGDTAMKTARNPATTNAICDCGFLLKRLTLAPLTPSYSVFKLSKLLIGANEQEL